jgi:hypothetical protein
MAMNILRHIFARPHMAVYGTGWASNLKNFGGSGETLEHLYTTIFDVFISDF